MAPHDYTPHQALEVLMRMLNSRDSDLARQVQSAIDAGKDVEERESAGRGRRSRIYRRTVRLSDEEALEIAIGALQACFIEQPLFVNSADRDFRIAGTSDRASDSSETLDRGLRTGVVVEGVLSEKRLEIELQTETQISIEPQQTLRLTPVPSEMIEQQQEHLAKLHSLTTFND